MCSYIFSTFHESIRYNRISRCIFSLTSHNFPKTFFFFPEFSSPQFHPNFSRKKKEFCEPIKLWYFEEVVKNFRPFVPGKRAYANSVRSKYFFEVTQSAREQRSKEGARNFSGRKPGISIIGENQSYEVDRRKRSSVIFQKCVTL